MNNKDAFSSCHPLVNFLYFGSVLVFSMFFMHPVSLAASLAGARLIASHPGRLAQLGLTPASTVVLLITEGTQSTPLPARAPAT